MPAPLLSVQEIFNRVFDRNTNKLNISGGAGSFQTTVGPTEPYTTVKAAIDAGNSRILVKGSTTETANIDIVAATMPNVYLYIIAGVTVDMGAFAFTDTGVVTTFTVEGQGEIEYTHSSGQLFQFAAGSKLTLNGITIDNNSSAGCEISASSNEYIFNVTVLLPNASGGGFLTGGTPNFYDNVLFVGGGSSCAKALDTSEANVSNLHFTGTFITDGGTSASEIVDLIDCTASGLFFDHDTNPIRISLLSADVTLIVNNSSQAVNIADVGFLDNAFGFGGAININGSTNCVILNAQLGGGTLDVIATDTGNYTNIVGGLLDLTDAGCTNNNFVNCRFSSALSVAGDRNKLTNCDFTAGITVVSGADNNGFMNCQAGPDAGGGALTITINSGSNNTRIIGCMTDAAISDAGTGTVLSANVVY